MIEKPSTLSPIVVKKPVLSVVIFSRFRELDACGLLVPCRSWQHTMSNSRRTYQQGIGGCGSHSVCPLRQFSREMAYAGGMYKSATAIVQCFTQGMLLCCFAGLYIGRFNLPFPLLPYLTSWQEEAPRIRHTIRFPETPTWLRHEASAGGQCRRHT